MLKTVHQWFNDKWDLTGYSLQKIVSNILTRHPESSFSVSKLHRIFNNPETKVSFEEVILIAEGMDQDPNELLAIIGGQEYKASADVGYKGAAQLIAEFERREAEIRKDHAFQVARAAEIREAMHQSFSAAQEAFTTAVTVISKHRDEELAKRAEIQHSVVEHLQNQVIDMREQLDEKDAAISKEKESAVADRKSLKWWRASAIVAYAILTSAFVYVLWELTNLDKGATAVLIRLAQDGLL